MYLHEYNFQETECRAPVHLFSCVPVRLPSTVHAKEPLPHIRCTVFPLPPPTAPRIRSPHAQGARSSPQGWGAYGLPPPAGEASIAVGARGKKEQHILQ